MDDDSAIRAITDFRSKRRRSCVAEAVNHLGELGYIKRPRKRNRDRTQLRTDWQILSSFWTDWEFNRAHRMTRSDFALLLQRLGRVNENVWDPSEFRKLQAIRSSGMYVPKEHKLASVLRYVH